MTLGNLLVAFIAKVQTESLTTFFWTFAVLMGAAATVFGVVAYFYKVRTYLQEAPPAH